MEPALSMRRPNRMLHEESGRSIFIRCQCDSRTCCTPSKQDFDNPAQAEATAWGIAIDQFRHDYTTRFHDRYGGRVGISDVAPTLTAVLEFETPGGNVGHVLNHIAAPFLANREPQHYEQLAVNQPAHQ